MDAADRRACRVRCRLEGISSVEAAGSAVRPGNIKARKIMFEKD